MRIKLMSLCLIIITAGVYLFNFSWAKQLPANLASPVSPTPLTHPTLSLNQSISPSSGDQIGRMLNMLQSVRTTTDPIQKKALFVKIVRILQTDQSIKPLGGGRKLILAYCQAQGVPIGKKIELDRLEQISYRYLFEQPRVLDAFITYVAQGESPDEHNELLHDLANNFFCEIRVSHFRKNLLPHLGNIHGQTWADVGTGNGVGLIFLAEATGRPPVAQDIAPELKPFWIYLGQEIPLLRDIRCVIGTANDVHLGTECLDGIMMNDVHMGGIPNRPSDDQQRVLHWLATSFKALRINGYLVITETGIEKPLLSQYIHYLTKVGLTQIQIYPKTKAWPVTIIITRKKP